VLTAAARVREAYLNYARTAIPSPVSGVVAKKNVQVGQRVAPGAALLTVAALDNVWVDANFKEVQLAALRVGQPVTLHADLYGSDVEYHGKVNGFAAGTGAAFALLPAQNATGNWIKIVQRVPVRVTLDAAEVAKNPLQVGLSMHVEVDTHNRDGDRLPRVGREAAPAAAATASPLDALAAQRVSAIIAANR
jgi:membrane fusion protein (multidrug efflux system)